MVPSQLLPTTITSRMSILLDIGEVDSALAKKLEIESRAMDKRGRIGTVIPMILIFIVGTFLPQ